MCTPATTAPNFLFRIDLETEMPRMGVSQQRLTAFPLFSPVGCPPAGFLLHQLYYICYIAGVLLRASPNSLFLFVPMTMHWDFAFLLKAKRHADFRDQAACWIRRTAQKLKLQSFAISNWQHIGAVFVGANHGVTATGVNQIPIQFTYRFARHKINQDHAAIQKIAVFRSRSKIRQSQQEFGFGDCLQYRGSLIRDFLKILKPALPDPRFAPLQRSRQCLLKPHRKVIHDQPLS